jgi:hypothetical protein
MPTATKLKSTDEVQPDPDVPVLVGIAEIVELCPDRKPNTIYRWRLPRNGKPPELPAPLAIVSRTPLWRLDTVLALIEEKQLRLNKKALTRIRKEQGQS